MGDEPGERVSDVGRDECRWKQCANDLTSVLTVQAVHLTEVQTLQRVVKYFMAEELSSDARSDEK